MGVIQNPTNRLQTFTAPLAATPHIKPDARGIARITGSRSKV